MRAIFAGEAAWALGRPTQGTRSQEASGLVPPGSGGSDKTRGWKEAHTSPLWLLSAKRKGRVNSEGDCFTDPHRDRFTAPHRDCFTAPHRDRFTAPFRV
uniref:Uncharacterized protein n=1 Tax=Knipowitschia caucasica TaxID=637954 RepID=A0AAV2MFY7_KNICA